MIEKTVKDIAAELNMHAPKVSITDGRRLGCRDMHMLTLEFGSKRSTVLIFQTDLDQLRNSIFCERLDENIRTAITRLKKMTES